MSAINQAEVGANELAKAVNQDSCARMIHPPLAVEAQGVSSSFHRRLTRQFAEGFMLVESKDFFSVGKIKHAEKVDDATTKLHFWWTLVADKSTAKWTRGHFNESDGSFIIDARASQLNPHTRPHHINYGPWDIIFLEPLTRNWQYMIVCHAIWLANEHLPWDLRIECRNETCFYNNKLLSVQFRQFSRAIF